MKNYIFIILILSFKISLAQVGVGTIAPDAQLDIRSSNQASPAIDDGILIPKVDNLTAVPTIAQQGMLVYLTTNISATYQKGFYYWDFPTLTWIGISSTANGDKDWYEVGTTTAPDAITDDMFHLGNTAIGKNTITNAKLDLETATTDIGIQNLNSNSSSNYLYNTKNTINSSGSGYHYGTYSTLNGNGSGNNYGTLSEFLGSGNGDYFGSKIENANSGTGFHYGNHVGLYGSGSGQQTGNFITISNSGNNSHYGLYNDIYGGGSGLHSGIYNSIYGSGSGMQYGVYNDIVNGGNNSHYGTYSTLSGAGTGIHYANFNTLSGTGTGNQFGNYTSISNSGGANHWGNAIFLNSSSLTGTRVGNSVDITNNGTGVSTGFSSLLTGTGTSTQTGQFNSVTNTGNGIHFGVQNSLTGTGTGDHFGLINTLSGNGVGIKVGVRSTITSTNSIGIYGVNNIINGGGTSLNYGVYNTIFGNSNGIQNGTYNDITNTGTGIHYGTRNSLSGTGAGTKYGTFNLLSTAAGGTHYGVYSEVLKPGATNFAGYFLGNVGIGTTIGNTYILPPSRGTVGQTMRTDATGNVTWANNSDFSWSTLGNAGTNGGNTTTAGTNFLGTTDNQNIDFRTNNIYRGRFSSLGEFFVGTLNTALPGDLMNSVGNVTFPWAINGYTTFNGGGVYGTVQAGGTTNFSSVQGEYYGSGLGSGIFGSYNGTNTSTLRAGVIGLVNNNSNGGASVYGLHQATTGNQHIGVLGQYNSTFCWGLGVVGLSAGGGIPGGNLDIGVLGWRANNSDFSGYFNGNHVIANGTKSASVGTSKGNQLLYVSEMPEVWFEDVGGGTLVNGTTHIELDDLFLETIFVDQTHPMRIFLQEEGESNGLIVIKDADNKGFTVKEKNNGTSNISFSYRIMAKRLHFQDHRFGNDQLWGKGDTRLYSQYAVPTPIDYNENVQFKENQKKNYKPTPMPEGFIDYYKIQEESKKVGINREQQD